MEVEYLPAELHRWPDDLTAAIEQRLEAVRDRFERVVLVYGRCAVGMDEVLERHGAQRLSGEHCYHILSDERFFPMVQEQPGTYFLTDYLCEDSSRLIHSLGLDRHPALKQIIFRNYTRVAYLDTGLREGLEEKAREIASYLGLPLVTVKVGVAGLEKRLAQAMDCVSPSGSGSSLPVLGVPEPR